MGTITKEMGLAGITTQPITSHTNPFKAPSDDIPSLVEEIIPCHYPPFEGTGTSSSTPYSWEVPPDAKHWTSKVLWLTGLYRISKLKANGERDKWAADGEGVINDPIIVGGKWGLVDDVAQKMWKKITIHVNGIPIEDPCSHPYPYRSMFESLTGHDALPKENIHKQLMNHLRDEIAEEGSNYQKLTKNSIKRFKNLAKEEWTEFCIPIHSDLMSLKQHIPPNNSFRVTAERWDDGYLFLTEEATNQKCKLELSHVELIVDKVESNTRQEKGGKKNITLTRLRDIPKIKNETDLSCRNLFRGEHLPQQVVVFLVDTQAFGGAWNKNAFQFALETISEAALVVDGVYVQPRRKLTNIRNGVKGWGTLEMYKHVHSSMGWDYLHRNKIIDMNFDQWTKDTFFLSFDRSKAQNNSFTMAADPLPGQYLDLKYTLASGNKLATAKTLVVMGIYKTFIEFNPDGSMAYIPHITT